MNTNNNDNNDNNGKNDKNGGPLAPINETQQFLKVWGETWSKVVGKGKTYICNFGKEGYIVKQLLKVMPFEELCLLAEKFFKEDDDFIRRTGYTIGIFKSQLPKLIADRKSMTKSDKIIEAARISQEKIEAEENGKIII